MAWPWYLAQKAALVQRCWHIREANEAVKSASNWLRVFKMVCRAFGQHFNTLENWKRMLPLSGAAIRPARLIGGYAA